ncbi:hypothetical protein B0T11DRAFT_314546 [Plectosphaerella cucumerina]|uniref:Polyketide synthase n=1 Tax=Plectosphaerella cucumerina TaxID=40658 RepID=A0A8K0TTA9_9PEZI|nr:hypothetical protein B0T11DRAFT_314546 [Plectosphaerella cucumerina]
MPSFSDAPVVGDKPAGSTRPSRPIAIIGMSCRFGGGVTSASKLWDLCASGSDGWSPIPAERFETRNTKDFPAGGYFLKEDISLFDAAFFNFSADVASSMDPQVRLLLESVYEATEQAGIPIDQFAGSRTSVFAGTYAKDFYDLQMRDPETLPISFITGNGTAMLANRISHFYDLRGPSVTIDTGCSSGLTAVHQACQSIYAGDADVAIAGGSEVMLNREMLAVMAQQGVLGPEGKCFAWDDRAHGYGRGEGVGTLILKPLDDALRDGNNVHAVIRQIGVNQDGKTTTITSPSMEAQRTLIRECYARAGLDLAQTGYVEAHMTGTAVGDPIEAEAIAQTFGQSRPAGEPVYVGSVKTNVGHTEPVSGIAAVIKTVFSLKNAKIAPNLNYINNNPKIPIQEWNVAVPTSLMDWPEGKPLRASVNNFGYGGSNSHVILESSTLHESQGQVVACSSESKGDRSLVYLLSAKDAAAAQGMVANHADYLKQALEDKAAKETKPALTPESLAYSLSERRSRFPCVAAVRASSLKELAAKLEQVKAGAKPAHGTKKPRIGFVFNGQGAQWHAMGRELFASYPVFAASVDEADRILREDYGATWSLREELHRDDKTTRVHETNISQPINVALQLCLVDLLSAWGVFPSAVTSHSSGEIAAAYSAGILSFRQALGVVYHRGRLALEYQERLALAGGMVAAGLGAEAAKAYLADIPGVVVACVNSADSVTLSGDLDALEKVAARLKSDGIFARKLKVPLAYHSHHMQHMAQAYTEALAAILPGESSDAQNRRDVVFSSPVAGQVLEDAAAALTTPEHWVRNLVSPVLFSEAFGNMISSVDVLLEIGAHSTLSGPIRSILGTRSLPYASCLKRNTDATATIQEAACELLRQGYPVSLSGVNLYEAPSSGKYPFIEDLPSYAWNHATSYWIEPRASRESRFDKTQPHELLGTPVHGGDGSTFAWRNFLRVSEVPWLADHRVETRVVLPGAAYVAMAIEAVRLLTSSSEDLVRGYRLRDVDIMNALTIPESSVGVEVMLVLRPCSEKELDHKGWYDFELSSLAAGAGSEAWVTHCKGGVAVEMSNAVRAATATTEAKPNETTFFGEETSSTVRQVDIENFFKSLRDVGLYHGPVFQNFIDSRASGSRAITNLSVSRAAEVEQNYVLHPATLDSIIQAAYVDVAQLQQDSGTMMLPRSIRSMFVPRSLKRQAGDKLQALTHLVKSDKHGSTTDISVLNADEDVDDKVAGTCDFVQIRGFYVQAVERGFGNDANKGPRVCFKSRWELDILNGLPKAVRESMPVPASPADVEMMTKCTKASYYLICDALTALASDSAEAVEAREWHHKRYVKWMGDIVEQGKRGELGPGSRVWHKASRGMKQMLIDELAQGTPTTRLLCRVGAKLPEIVRGEITPLELMMADNLLNDFYMDVPAFQRLYSHLHKVVDLFAVKRPGARVLEIGAGTGGASGVVLEAFAARAEEGMGGSLLGHYTYTDISSGFFEAARQKFAAWVPSMDFAKLDIGSDPEAQGIELGSYDFVVASAVLHATKSLSTTMSNVRKLLKPDGKLIMLEQTRDDLEAQVIFGTTPGWWLGEEPHRQSSPLATLETWDAVLKDTGFSGIDFEVPDLSNQDLRSASVIVSSNKGSAVEIAGPISGGISIVHAGTPPPQEWLVRLVQAIVEATGSQPQVQSISEAQVDGRLCIFTGEMGTPFLSTMDSASFEQIRHLLVTCRGILWLSSSGAGSDQDQKPLYAQSVGLLRTLRSEDQTQHSVHLDFEEQPWDVNQVRFIAHVLTQEFSDAIDPFQAESEYKVIDGELHMSRVYYDAKTDDAASKTAVSARPELQPFNQPRRVLDWESGKTGVLSDAYFTDDFRFSEGLESGMIEVEPKAFGLNFRDVMVALGQVAEDGLVYSEMCGVVSRLGPDTENSGLKVGDRVCGAGWGHITNCVRTGWEDVAKIPENISFEEAASVPTIYITVYHSLVNIARLSRGESILIHAGTGGVGQAAIMLAKHLGAVIYVTCSTEEKRDMLIERYQIDPSHIFSSRDPSFAPAVMSATTGQGVDVLLNCLAGPLLKAGWECMARFGRFIEIGKVDMQNGRHLDMSPFSRCATISGVDILSLAAYKKDVYRAALEASLRLISEGTVKTVSPVHVYSIAEMEKPLRQLQHGTHMGKFIVVPTPDAQVKVITQPRAVCLDPESTYMIVGGVTGIGRAVATWMAQKGARNLVVTSRNAESHRDTPSLVQSLGADGCKVLVRNCDVADEASLLSLISGCEQAGLPPIKGVLTTAMVLDDTVIERMTFEQWQHAVLPKVAGTMNLHKHLAGLSFFIMMSSTAGIFGSPSQANYNAGNAFQDALARYRTARGLPAVSIDLGIVDSVGFVAEASDYKKQIIETSLRNGGVGAPLALDHLLRLVEDAVRHPLRASPDDSQVVTCLASWDDMPAESTLRRDRRFGTLRLARSLRKVDVAGGSGGAGEENSSFALTQKLCSPGVGGVAGAAKVIADALAAKMAEVFHLVSSEIDRAMPMSHYGVDSLVAVELRNWLGTAAKSKVSVFEILQTPSLVEFAALVAGRSELLKTT